MNLFFYDEDQVLFGGSPLRTLVNGHTGGSYEKKFYIRNTDVTRWYSNVTLSVVTDVYDALGESGTSGISIKFLYGETRPTEAEWDIVLSGEPLVLPDIGSNPLADTSTYHPIWIRVYVPGNTPADIIDSNTLRLSAVPRVVGA
jgi:hypothetical protein